MIIGSVTKVFGTIDLGSRLSGKKDVYLPPGRSNTTCLLGKNIYLRKEEPFRKKTKDYIKFLNDCLSLFIYCIAICLLNQQNVVIEKVKLSVVSIMAEKMHLRLLYLSAEQALFYPPCIVHDPLLGERLREILTGYNKLSLGQELTTPSYLFPPEGRSVQ